MRAAARVPAGGLPAACSAPWVRTLPRSGPAARAGVLCLLPHAGHCGLPGVAAVRPAYLPVRRSLLTAARSCSAAARQAPELSVSGQPCLGGSWTCHACVAGTGSSWHNTHAVALGSVLLISYLLAR